MAISTVSPITSFLIAQKDEVTAAQTYAKTDAATANEIATFEKDAASITTVDGLLKNYSVLQVVLGAYGLSSLSGQTAVIKDLLTQDPSSSTSLAAKSSNASWQAFAKAFAVWSEHDGVSTVSPFTTGSSTISVTADPTETTELTLTATLPSSSSTQDSYTTAGVTTYDSSGNATQVALQWTRSSSDPLSWNVSAYDTSGNGAVATNSYNVTFNSDGSIASVSNAVSGESIVTSSSSDLTAFFPISLTNSDGTTQDIKLVLGTVDSTTDGTVMATSDTQTTSVSQADSMSGSGTSLTMSSVVVGSTTGTGQTYLSSPLDPDQTIDDSDSIPVSMRSYLSVKWTQTGNSTWSVSVVNPYDSSSVTSSSVYSVSFDSLGNVYSVNGQSTTTIPTLTAVMGGTTYSINLESPTLSTSQKTTESTLTNPSATTSYDGVDMTTLVDDFEQTQYEQSKANQKDGVGNALYFSRKISGVTTLAQVMSDSTLLKVVETVLGYNPDQIGALDYSQQVQMLTGKIDFSQFTTADGIKKYAEQYLAMLQINPQTSSDALSTMDLFGGSNSSEGIVALFDVSSSSSGSSSLYSALF
ncbi:DUF1217 domain-containing protein [Acetobacter peroxydans]|jgi:hypothetical protein|uniref:DUF1217 domain-containing protein n=1 Tax=Acetobacter peroxydans TaxID=104098 RepID=UPI00235533B1|nr:DUF1217 domain-containing protein [Acetobacter peroxydans]MCH4142812.1 DUF1217 domain-containing protein [Acetobacter peroxydans]MCI1394281.1 DUF1217 domain-containing protein [Acetobacter peroxydans]MCI1411157.1 DUF1217 domain-containing protein [Acetobacter peroxydans]MCI1438859.1 DUF1217 domain-containing protein [Acetobacter peroxydans]MCI1566254.1 DUF1217 domain-containing protein [Acetobacter peroxydans]